MKLNPPTVGPIVGAAAAATARIFMRGELELSGRQPRRAHGVLRYRQQGAAAFADPLYIKLNPNFDMTGVAVFEGLSADTTYEYQAGWLFSEVATADIDVDSLLEWAGLPLLSFKTASADDERARSFVVGSCRYLLRLLGGTFLDNRGDKTFESIANQIRAGRAVDALVMLGDQIYADDLLFVDPDRSIDAFFERYRDAFTTEHLQALMARVPTYMTLDDHEIEDNWPTKASSKDYVQKFPVAIHAFQTYQLSHSPLFALKGGRIDGTPERLWYSFSDGCADFFMTDSRTERLIGGPEQHMLGPAQFDALKAWLANGSGRVKFVATSVPPFGAIGADKWEGFVAQRDALLDHIFSKKVRRVVFLSGDVHASFTAELTSNQDKSFKVLSVVSSPFFWPYPSPFSFTFPAQGKLASKSANGYEFLRHTDVHKKDNFTRITCDRTQLTVETFERKGGALGAPATYRF